MTTMMTSNSRAGLVELNSDVPETRRNMSETDSAQAILQEGLAFYLRFVSRNSRLLSPEEETQVAIRARRGDLEARQQLALSNLRLVLRVARRCAPAPIPGQKSSINMMDLIQEGNMGLMKAVEKFNPKLGYRFSTYATWWIQQSVLRALHDNDRAIRLPGHVQDALNKLQRCKESIKENAPTEKAQSPDNQHGQLAKKLGMSIRKVRQLEQVGQKTLALDSELMFGDGHSQSLGDTIADDTVQDFADAIHGQKSVALLHLAMMEYLDERERDIICRRFGVALPQPAVINETTVTDETVLVDDLNRNKLQHVADALKSADSDRMTLESIGQMYGVSRECVRQTEARAIRKLRSSMLLRHLTE